TPPSLPELSDVSSRAEDELKPAPHIAPPLNSSVAHSGDVAFRHIADTPNRSPLKPEANAPKPPQPSGDATPSEEEPRFTMGDSTAVKAHLAQPTATITTHGGQDRPATTNAVLPEAVRAAPNTADAKDAKPQAASAAPTSTPAENV